MKGWKGKSPDEGEGAHGVNIFAQPRHCQMLVGTSTPRRMGWIPEQQGRTLWGGRGKKGRPKVVSAPGGSWRRGGIHTPEEAHLPWGASGVRKGHGGWRTREEHGSHPLTNLAWGACWGPAPGPPPSKAPSAHRGGRDKLDGVGPSGNRYQKLLAVPQAFSPGQPAEAPSLILQGQRQFFVFVIGVQFYLPVVSYIYFLMLIFSVYLVFFVTAIYYYFCHTAQPAGSWFLGQRSGLSSCTGSAKSKLLD